MPFTSTVIGVPTGPLVGVIVVMADFALRFMWWGGPRARDRQREGGGGPQAILALLGIVLLLLAPLAARLMQFAVSRRREALADVSGVAMTRYPPGLIAALEKLKDKGLGPRDLGVPAARSCMLKGDGDAALAWLRSIPQRFLPRDLEKDPAFARIKDRPEFKALFEPSAK